MVLQVSSQAINLYQIHDDILLQIFDHLHLDDMIRLKRTCRRWYVLLDDLISTTRAVKLGHFVEGSTSSRSGVSFDCNDENHSIYFLNQLHHNHNMWAANNAKSLADYQGTCKQITTTCTNNLKNSKTSNENSKQLSLITKYKLAKRRPAFLNYRRLCCLPADDETKAFNVTKFDYLHRALKSCSQTVTILSLGHIAISQRVLLSLVKNLPFLEHVELIGCATQQQQKTCNRNSLLLSSLSSQESRLLNGLHERVENVSDLDQIIFANEQDKSQARMLRWTYIRSCSLVKNASADKNWQQLKHLLVKDCNKLNEFTLCIILAMTFRSLREFRLDSCQHLIGEFLNYCSPNLQVLSLKHCPLIEQKFLNEYSRLRSIFSLDTNNQELSLHIH